VEAASVAGDSPVVAIADEGLAVTAVEDPCLIALARPEYQPAANDNSKNMTIPTASARPDHEDTALREDTG